MTRQGQLFPTERPLRPIARGTDPVGPMKCGDDPRLTHAAELLSAAHADDPWFLCVGVEWNHGDPFLVLYVTALPSATKRLAITGCEGFPVRVRRLVHDPVTGGYAWAEAT